MANKKKNDHTTPARPPQYQLPIQQLHPVRDYLDTDERRVEGRKIEEIMELVYLPTTLDEQKRNARLVRAVDLFESLGPTDGAETMLATQMVGTHHAALECLRRANLPGRPSEGRDLSLKQAIRLMALYAQQLAALDKHRGKGQQKVTVEHVHVEAGGQAIVGNVEAGGMAAGTNSTASSKTVETRREAPLVEAYMNGAKARSRKPQD